MRLDGGGVSLLAEDVLIIHMLAAGGVVVDHGAALVIFVCQVQLLQQFVDYLHDIGGQQVAKPSQTVWDFFLLIHIHVFR